MVHRFKEIIILSNDSGRLRRLVERKKFKEFSRLKLAFAATYSVRLRNLVNIYQYLKAKYCRWFMSNLSKINQFVEKTENRLNVPCCRKIPQQFSADNWRTREESPRRFENRSTFFWNPSMIQPLRSLDMLENFAVGWVFWIAFR